MPSMPGLYIHVPFCWRKCRYCDFYSLPLAPDEPEGVKGPDRASRYLDGLQMELGRLPADFKPDTIYIGGGTPTVLNQPDFERLLEIALRAAGRQPVEWTCEANPGTLTEEHFAAMRVAGVDRLSLGVQSFDVHMLSFLGRIHSAGEAEEAYRDAREHGFENINLDLMFAIPGATREALGRDLERIVQLAPEHVACYALAFEAGTELTKARDRWLFAEVPDEEQLAQYNLIRETLRKAGYVHYEISNFARPGRECRHNLLYWCGGEYIGCGPSAHTHWKGIRRGNVRDLRDYYGKLLNGEQPREFEEHLDPEAKARETLVMSLRRVAGVSDEELRSATGFGCRDVCGEPISRLVADGLLVEENNRLRLADDALFISDTVFAELV